MAPECRFVLPKGRNCRCAATRNQEFCRHHAPRPAIPGPPPIPKRDRYSRIQHWAQLGRNLAWLDPAEIPLEVHAILHSLLQDGISDREAGRLLRGLLQRFGSVPFPVPEPPDEWSDAALAVPPMAPKTKSANPSPAISPSPTLPFLHELQRASQDPDRLIAFLSALGEQAFDEQVRKRPPSAQPPLHQTRPTMTSTRPSLIATRPHPHQTRPAMHQPQPSAK
jgi:hypothetical protein